MSKQQKSPLNEPLKTVVVHRTEVLLVDAGEAARILAISKRKLWELTNRSAIPHLRIGRSVKYPVEALREWIRAQSTGSGLR